MCGLCGVLANKITKEDFRIFQDLMIVSTIRGADGAGIVGVPKAAGQSVEIMRSEGTAADLATGIEFFKLEKKNLSCLMGHARLPTSGNWGIEDVHPHVSGPIVGMHNGTMKSVAGKPVTMKDSDSRMLFTSIRNSGIDEAIKTSEGAYALSYINTTLDTLSLLRNKMRPLCFGRLEGVPEKIFWASEGVFLRMVLGRIYPGKKVTVLRANPDVLFTFKLHFANNCDIYDHREVKPYETEPVKTVDTTGTGTDVVKMYQTRHGHFVTQEEILDILQGTGCSWCSDHPTITEAYGPKPVVWIYDNQFICHHCVTHDEYARDYALSVNADVPPKAVNLLQ